ncbi:phosphopantetheine-binding protein [Tsukamurella paurometabola]|uniref:phosphopantetheine-binding protein n=1 Tax=Tsukamurella paurometabola TaxID=2061 RepID=UPI00019F09C9
MPIATEDVRQDIATILEVPVTELGDDAVLADLGLDSMRMMTLVEGWRAAGNDIDFADLAPLPTLGEWLEVLVSS